ncbi:MAG: hypothetical protein WC149_06000 [Arcobacteraceae bacterium]
MAKSQNKNSVKSEKMDMLAARSNENRNATLKAFSKDTTVKEQVVNARKGANLDKKKAKAKSKAKMAKASKKKAKK